MGLNSLYHNHVLANLSYLFVILLGVLAYNQLPREKAPYQLATEATIFITIPGATAEDIREAGPRARGSSQAWPLLCRLE